MSYLLDNSSQILTGLVVTDLLTDSLPDRFKSFWRDLPARQQQSDINWSRCHRYVLLRPLLYRQRSFY